MPNIETWPREALDACDDVLRVLCGSDDEALARLQKAYPDARTAAVGGGG